MTAYKTYRSRKTVRARQYSHDFGVPGERGQKGDYLVDDGGTKRVIGREQFEREYEAIPDPNTPALRSEVY